ncbi:glycosyltransferase [Advenella alkanexedens]|uniref:glycosyltransferase n=1 Tax=Advenella alkanexedens TaxID=1481665 RepID=UPI002676FED6|nr:glycosyltransferase [Advenella alkanexedens]WKU19013.1 glycosyltransferase [Advenella alkanexedens]
MKLLKKLTTHKKELNKVISKNKYINSILINAANLNVGGGIQVAVSFIYEMTQLPDYNFSNINIIVSSKVHRELMILNADTNIFKSYRVIDLIGLKSFFSNFNCEIKKYDVVFSIFGPNYLRKKAKKEIVGFAQPWIIDNSAYPILSTLEKLKTKLSFFAKQFFFKRSNIFIVELEHVQDGLYKKNIAYPGTVHVVYNCISSIYFEPEKWRKLTIDSRNSNFKIGFITRDYIHKNTSILPAIKQILLNRYKLNVDFFVTFNEQEWKSKDANFKSSILNVGSLAVTQCPSFYQAMDAVIFPSLLECFSATPLEAMAMEKPLFASDRRFVRDICNDYAFYFDPHDPSNVADVIATYIHTLHKKDSTRLTAAKEHAINFSTAKDRAKRYLEIIEAELLKKTQ